MKLDSRRPEARRRTFARLLLASAAVSVMVALTLLASSCSGPPQGSALKNSVGAARPIAVTTTFVTTKSVPVELTALIGSVQAYSTVAVKSEVTGTLVKVAIRKGQSVKKGDRLFEIDPRPFQAAVAQSEGAVTQAVADVAQAQAAVAEARAAAARDQVQEANARKTLARQAELLQKRVATPADYDKARTDADALAAMVRADEAAIHASEATVHAKEAAVRANKAAFVSAQLQLERCTINSPLDGVAGNILVNEGNAVPMYGPTLVTINQIHPVDVFFSVPQKDLPAVKKYSALGTLKAKALIPQESDGEEIGDLTFIDNSVDRTSGTITLGATFENKNERLWPGQYVDVTLILTVQKDAVVVSAKAIQIGSAGKFVFVVNADRTAGIRPVTVGVISGGDTVLLSGLKVGEEVVTDGQFQLTEGARTEMKEIKP
jgi:membrane fusion protein, multidrug efflux system